MGIVVYKVGKKGVWADVVEMGLGGDKGPSDWREEGAFSGQKKSMEVSPIPITIRNAGCDKKKEIKEIIPCTSDDFVSPMNM